MKESQFGKGASDRPKDYMKPEAFQHSEIASASIPPKWIEKNPNGGFITYPKRNQGTQSTCTTYAKAKALAVDELSENGKWRELSPRSIYPYVFSPGGGSNSLIVAKYAVKNGMTLEHLLQTDGLTELQAESSDGHVKDSKLVGLVYAPRSFVECGADFDTIAGILETHKAQGIKKVVTASVVGENNGTWTSMYPKPPAGPGPSNWFHRIVVTDYGLINGKKYLAIDNSWGEGVGYKGQQFLSEDYAKTLYGALYTLNQPDDWQQTAPNVVKPTYQWNTNLMVGSAGPDVLALQQALQSLGMFPVNSVVAPTGKFYGITKTAVIMFQSSFGLPATGIVDLVTRTVLNGIFK